MAYRKVTQFGIETECQTNEQMENKNFVKRQAQRQISFITKTQIMCPTPAISFWQLTFRHITQY